MVMACVLGPIPCLPTEPLVLALPRASAFACGVGYALIIHLLLMPAAYIWNIYNAAVAGLGALADGNACFFSMELA